MRWRLAEKAVQVQGRTNGAFVAEARAGTRVAGPQRGQDEAAGKGSAEDCLGDEDVEVGRQLQRRAEALDEGHRGSQRSGHPEPPGRPRWKVKSARTKSPSTSDRSRASLARQKRTGMGSESVH